MYKAFEIFSGFLQQWNLHLCMVIFGAKIQMHILKSGKKMFGMKNIFGKTVKIELLASN